MINVILKQTFSLQEKSSDNGTFRSIARKITNRLSDFISWSKKMIENFYLLTAIHTGFYLSRFPFD